MVGVSYNAATELKVSSAHGIFSQIEPSGYDAIAGNAKTSLFWAIMTGADTVITVAVITGSGIQIAAGVAVEYSGTLIIPDSIAVGVGSIGTNAANTGNLSNTNANALYVGVIGIKTTSSTVNTSWAFNNVAPFTIVNSITTNNAGSANVDRGICYLDAIVSTISSRNANINHTYGINRYSGLIATFDQAASGGGGLRTAGHGGLAA
jgi:hypothetical protein